MAERSTPRFAVISTREGEDVAARLNAYLRLRLGVPALEYKSPPAPILGGFDTSIYAFELDSAGTAYSGELIARVFGTAAEAERARYEGVVQNAVASLGYPAPEVLLVEPEAGALGGPFIVMRRMPGRVMLDMLLGTRMGAMATLLGQEHARLHALDADAFRRAIGDAVDPRRLASVDALLGQYQESVASASLDGLRPALRWLEEHRPAPGGAQAVCHGDFHPLNVLVTDGEVTGVVDWAWVGVAAPEMDVGATVALLTHGPVGLPRPLLPLVRAIRAWVVRRYLRGYASARAIDARDVRYFEALRLFQFLLEAGEQLQAMAGVIDSDMQSPFFAPHIRTGVLKRLRRITGTEITLPSAGA